MLRICSRALVNVGMRKPCHLVKPVSATLVAGRNLTQQKGLPSQPVPPLQQSCEIYLSYLEPLVEEDELKRTKELVEEFQKAGGVGERLQQGLEWIAQNSDNWLTDPAVKKLFLDSRTPLPVHSSFAIHCPRMDRRDLRRNAAKLIAATLELKTMIDNETLPVEYWRGVPFCMDQYKQALSACRIPRLETDSMEFYTKTSKHISVVHNCQFFVLDVYNSDGTPLTVDQLCVQLERICNSSPQTIMDPVGILTTGNRDTWAKTYNDLIRDKTNKESVLAIQSSIFTVCLDGAMPPVADDMQRRSAILQILGGGGSQWNSGNRWFDKSLQIIVGEDGACGFQFSHVTCDGGLGIALCDHVVENMKKSQVTQSPVEDLPVPQKLHFNITPEIKKDIEEAKQLIDIQCRDVELWDMAFEHFGKNLIKANKISPDAFVQIALQLAYYRMHQLIVPVMETVSLRTFKRGRLAYINSNSPASAAFVKAFDDPKKQNSEKVDLLKKASNAHTWYTRMAMNGQSIEEHLEALMMLAIHEGIPMPEIFTDDSFTKLFDYKIWTTHVTSKIDCMNLCVGPNCPGLFEVTYTFKNDKIDMEVADFEATDNEKNAAAMIRAVENALLDMRTLLQPTSRDCEANPDLKQ